MFAWARLDAAVEADERWELPSNRKMVATKEQLKTHSPTTVVERLMRSSRPSSPYGFSQTGDAKSRRLVGGETLHQEVAAGCTLL